MNPSVKATAPKEADIQKSILEWLNLRGHFVWRNNTGAYVGKYKGKSRFFRFGMKGSSDIVGVAANSGKLIAIEVKCFGKTPTPDQMIFLKRVKSNNGIACIANSIDDVIAVGL
ncbi:MAG TPA: VRR-NUC domain-containing protein [Patescibacteria group bacterium]